jgi:hypothetical protein
LATGFFAETVFAKELTDDGGDVIDQGLSRDANTCQDSTWGVSDTASAMSIGFMRVWQVLMKNYHACYH